MIGDLYDANDVIVGQAAVLFAPNGTALPSFLTINQTDPFDNTPWTAQTLTAPATSTFTLTDTRGNKTSSLSDTSTGAQIATALNALNDGATWTVTPTANPGPFTITASEPDVAPLTLQVTTGSPTLTGGLWVPTGATDQGWKFATNKTTNDISIEEQSTPVGQTISAQKVLLEGSLSEDLTRTLALAYNATVTQTAAAAGNPGYDTVTLTDTVLYYAVALITNHYNGRPRIIYAPKWTQLANTDTTFRRAAAKRMYPVSFATVCKPSQIEVVNFTADHL